MTKYHLVAVLITLLCSGSAFAQTESYGKEDLNGLYLENLISSLPPQKAAQFRKTMKNARDENKEIATLIPGIRQELRSMIMAAKFDPDAFITKSNELEQLRDRMAANQTAAFASALGDLSQEERKSISVSTAAPRLTKRHIAPEPAVTNVYPSALHNHGPLPH